MERSHGQALWKGIMLEFDVFYSCVGFKMGNGRQIRFWTDTWCGDQSLESRFPLLYALAVNKDATVMEYLEGTGSFIFWNV